MTTPPRDYAPHLTLQELHEAKLTRLQKIERWTHNGLVFMTGVVTGTLIVGTILWGM